MEQDDGYDGFSSFCPAYKGGEGVKLSPPIENSSRLGFTVGRLIHVTMESAFIRNEPARRLCDPGT